MKTCTLRFSSIDRLFAISIFVSLSTAFLKLKHLLTDYPRLSSSQPWHRRFSLYCVNETETETQHTSS